MELTGQEQKALDRLIKSQRQWSWFRFISLFTGLAVIGVGIWLQVEVNRNLVDATQQLSFTKSLTGMEVYFASVAGGQLAVARLLPVLGGILIGLTVARWRGSPILELVVGLASRMASSRSGPKGEL